MCSEREMDKYSSRGKECRFIDQITSFSWQFSFIDGTFLLIFYWFLPSLQNLFISVANNWTFETCHFWRVSLCISSFIKTFTTKSYFYIDNKRKFWQLGAGNKSPFVKGAQKQVKENFPALHALEILSLASGKVFIQLYFPF